MKDGNIKEEKKEYMVILWYHQCSYRLAYAYDANKKNVQKITEMKNNSGMLWKSAF